MTRYYELIEHANTTDEAESVVDITSSEGEPKNIVRLLITTETNAGYLKGNIERETILEHLTAQATMQNFLEIPIDAEIDVGDTFKLTLKNQTAGTNGEIYGLIEYAIR